MDGYRFRSPLPIFERPEVLGPQSLSFTGTPCVVSLLRDEFSFSLFITVCFLDDRPSL